MIPELGHFALIIALGLALLQGVYPLWGAWRAERALADSKPQAHAQRLMALGTPLAVGQFLFTLAGFLCLTWAFIANDFTLAYVAHNSNSALPLQYRISAVWGAHEGSLLLWVLILTAWAAAVALFSRHLPTVVRARVLGVIGLITIGFHLFVLLTSNPFDRILPMFPVDGRDLNPLLQDVGLIFHPPLLYMGYVGLVVPFAFAIAALMGGKLDANWARWSRPWTLIAWLFLTLGIALGSWWAYYELGWGGWWFWDPVENASFMPWLVATALLHSLAVSEQRGTFKAWTVLLAIASFSLVLLGAFLVRSGVLVSVHAFTTDPARGVFILGFLLLVVGGSLLLYAMRASQVKSKTTFTLFSREVSLLAGNILLATLTLVVLLGTLLPLVHKQIGMGTISVGPPFFNQIFSVLAVPFCLVMGLAPLVRWKKHDVSLLRTALPVLIASVVLGVALPWLLAELTWNAALGLSLSLWITFTLVWELVLRARTVGLSKLPLRYWGMIAGHLGLVVTLIGIAFSSSYSIERDLRLGVGEDAVVGGYRFVFMNEIDVEGPNYDAATARIGVYRATEESSLENPGRQIATMVTEKRFYRASRQVMTEAAIDPGLTRDLYVALGEELPDGAWAMRIYVKPFVRWIWLGSLFMGLAGLLAAADRRYRVVSRAKQPADNAVSPAPAAQGGR